MSSFIASSSSSLMNNQISNNLNPNCIVINEKQRGNPLLKLIKNVSYQFHKDVIPDYIMSSSCCIFLSVKYHLLHPKVNNQALIYKYIYN
jgi:DNA excision repair protein ERCC-1